MKISKQLNLVVPVQEDDETIYIHSAPISTEVFEKYHRVIGKTFSVIYSEGLNVVAGPRVAAMVLKDVAQEMPRKSGTWWEGVDGIENGLMNELRRLSNVSCMDANGWTSLPLDVALARGIISLDAVKEAEGKIVFFILCSTMHTGAQKIAMLDAMSGLWDVEITSLNCTEYTNSLRTSTHPENTAVPA